MRKILIIFIGIVSGANILSVFARNYYTDEISLLAEQMIYSIRLRGNEMVSTSSHPEIWDSAASRFKIIVGKPDPSDYTDDDDERIIPDRLLEFERDFKIKYVYNESLIPPYFKSTNSTDSFPAFSRIGFIPSQPDTVMNYLGPITGVEIGIVPELHNNYLKINFYRTYTYWDTEYKNYFSINYSWIIDNDVVTEDPYWGSYIYEYSQCNGWEEVSGNFWQSNWTNEIPQMCIEAAKISASIITSAEEVDSAFIDWRYLTQYVKDEDGGRVRKEPDYPLKHPDLALAYLFISSHPQYLEEYRGLESLKSGSYFFRPKYRLDGDKFYVDVEVYFAKLDDKLRLTYDHLRTDTYTYQLDSENQWQLIN